MKIRPADRPKLMFVLLTLGCLANSALAQEGDLSKLNLLPLEREKPWDRIHRRFPLEGGLPRRVDAKSDPDRDSTTGTQSTNPDNQNFTLPGTMKSNVFSKTYTPEDPWHQLERALQPPSAEQQANIAIKTTKLFRYFKINGVPDLSLIGFPRAANKGAPESQRYTLRTPLNPLYAKYLPSQSQQTELPFGIALNGVLITRGPDDYWNINNHPISKNTLLNLRQRKLPTLIGYAADGFPIYGPHGFKRAEDSQSELIELKTSFRLRKQKKVTPSTKAGETDTIATTSSADTPLTENKNAKSLREYEYIDKLGDLDDYNGRFGVTAEYPNGTYYYVISNSYPFIPIALREEPDKTFRPRRQYKEPRSLHDSFEGRRFLK